VRFDPFKSFSGWNDTDYVKAEVEKAFAKGAHVSVKTLRRALARVVADGVHGPIGERDWESISGYRMTMARARHIVGQAQAAELPTIYLDDPNVGVTCSGAEDCRHEDHDALEDPGPMFHSEPIEIDRSTLVEWYFGDLKPIYGTVWM
jgi:hypothetical protein